MEDASFELSSTTSLRHRKYYEKYFQRLRCADVLFRLVDATDMPFVVFDHARGILFANKAIEAALGWRPEEIVGSSVDDLFPAVGRDIDLVAGGTAQSFTTGQAVGHWESWPCRTGGGRRMVAEVSLVRTMEHGRPVFGARIRPHFSRQASSGEGDTNRSLPHATESRSLQADLTTILEDHIRPMIINVLSYAEMITAEILGPLDSETYSPYVSDLHRACMKLHGHTEALRDFAKLRADAAEPKTEDFILLPLLTELLGKLDPGRRKGMGRIVVEMASPKLRLSADRRLIGQSIFYVCLNSLVNSSPSSPVHLSVHRERHSGDIIIEVASDGPATSTAQVDRILSESMTTDGVSLFAMPDLSAGLGLATASCVLRAHGGALEFGSRQQNPNCTLIRLPNWRVDDELPENSVA